jgi:signal transduction histidine kinase
MDGFPTYEPPADLEEGDEAFEIPVPAEEDLGKRIPDADLRVAVLRILDRWRQEVVEGDQGREAELTDALVSLAEVLADVRRGEEPGDLRGDGVVLRRRLLDLLQSELVQVWTDDEILRSDANHILGALEALERVRSALSPEWESRFGVDLEGPSGLELAVEVAHDFRSPLSSVLFLADTLREGGSGELNELQKRQLSLIYAAALSMVSMAGDVVDLGRGGLRVGEREPNQFSIREVMESVQGMVQPMADAKGLSLVVRPPEQDSRQGDAEALRRVLLNLTTNAVKFTSEGFIELSGSEQGPTKVLFSVRDTGPGIRSGGKQDLYEPFRPFQGRSGFHFSGTGLGLTIARKLVRALDGELHYETQENLGTRFYFTVPLSPVEPL